MRWRWVRNYGVEDDFGIAEVRRVISGKRQRRLSACRRCIDSLLNSNSNSNDSTRKLRFTTVHQDTCLKATLQASYVPTALLPIWSCYHSLATKERPHSVEAASLKGVTI